MPDIFPNTFGITLTEDSPMNSHITLQIDLCTPDLALFSDEFINHILESETMLGWEDLNLLGWENRPDVSDRRPMWWDVTDRETGKIIGGPLGVSHVKVVIQEIQKPRKTKMRRKWEVQWLRREIFSPIPDGIKADKVDEDGTITPYEAIELDRVIPAFDLEILRKNEELEVTLSEYGETPIYRPRIVAWLKQDWIDFLKMPLGDYDNKEEPIRDDSLSIEEEPSVFTPKRTPHLIRWQSTWRIIQEPVMRGMTKPVDLKAVLKGAVNTRHLAKVSDHTLRQIIKAELAGQL